MIHSKLTFTVTILLINLNYPSFVSTQVIKSPCPAILNVHENSIEVGTWSGTLKLNLDYETQGLFLQIDMDSKINLITNNFGVITTKNNEKYMLEDFYYVPKDEKLEININVKYNGANPTPQIKKIYVNGHLKCPEAENLKTLFTKLKQKFIGPPTNSTDIITTEVPYTTIPFFDIDE